MWPSPAVTRRYPGAILKPRTVKDSVEGGAGHGVKKDVSKSRAPWITRRMMTLAAVMRKMVR